jgi:DNA-binding NtrC family response regulator
MKRGHVLVVDDDASVRKVLGALLENAGWSTTRAASGAEALDLVRSADPDVVVSDLKMPGMDGLELLGHLRSAYPEIPVVLLTAHGSVDAAVEAMKRGAHDFLTKPFDKEQVLAIVEAASGQAERGRRDFQGPLVSGARCGIVGDSPAMTRVKDLIEKIAPSPATVLVTGPTGTGKELVASALHVLSDRSQGPFVRLNCGALPETLVESELFGHERGAFTGADKRKPGRFELADGGLLFLDEVGELPPAAQVKLLRVLQDGLVDVVGGTQPLAVDVRLVAATNRDLEKSVADGDFREDLYYRLKVVELRLPPLSERLDDLPELVDCFLEKHAARLGREPARLAPEVLPALRVRTWKGNVRELEHAVERAVLLGEGPELEVDDFGFGESAAPAPSAPVAVSADGTTDLKAAARAAAAEAERRLIREALEATDSNVTQAAERLGLSRRGLQLKMKDLGLRED